MRYNKIIILSIIFILLGSYVYFFETGPTDKTEQVPETEKILSVDPEDVDEVRLKTEDNLFIFKKQGRQWQIVSPVQQDVRNTRVDTLFSVFDYAVIKEISGNPSDLSLYGLDDPEIEFGFRIKGNEAFTTLQLGDNSPYGINCYAKIKGEPRVFLVGLLYKQVLNQDLAFFQLKE